MHSIYCFVFLVLLISKKKKKVTTDLSITSDNLQDEKIPYY